MKIDADEKALLASVEGGEWKAAPGGKRERTRYVGYARATFRKDRRLNIRMSSRDVDAIQKRALAEGLPYQTLIPRLAAGRGVVRLADALLRSGTLPEKARVDALHVGLISWGSLQPFRG